MKDKDDDSLMMTTLQQQSVSLSQMVIGSVDTLRGSHDSHYSSSAAEDEERREEQQPTFRHDKQDDVIPSTWNDRPPLLETARGGEETPTLLKGMIRKGIPPPLRCAVWLSNIVQTVHPHQDAAYWHEYRTLAKVRALDHAYEMVLSQIIVKDDGDSDKNSTTKKSKSNNVDDPLWKQLEASTYGQVNAPSIPHTTEAGRLAQKRVLLALERVVALEQAPLLPTLTALLLTSMSESYAFCAVREMAHEASWYLSGVTAREHLAICRAFADVLRKLHPSTASYLDDRGVLDDDNLRPIFQDFFVGILPTKYCLRIFDIYTLEGIKVLFRFGVALLVLYKMEAHEQLVTISNADEWWQGLRMWAHSSRFPNQNFDLVVRKAYGLHGRGIRRQLRFPRRQILQRIIRMEEDRLIQQGVVEEYNSTGRATPLGLVAAAGTESSKMKGLDEDEIAKPILAQSSQVRLHLAEWLPLTLRMTNLELLYSTNYHGRSLEIFYNRVKHAKHTILLCEVLQNNKTAESSSSTPSCVIGMYASQAWRASSHVYGDGGCFLFRLEPDAKCWKWKPRPRTGSTSIHENESLLDHLDLEEDTSSQTVKTALLEQFMVGTRTYISMGGNEDGSAGFRLNEDFTRGESSKAVGFENEPLHGTDRGSVFEVGLVEVYGLVRSIDGRAA